MSTSINSLLLQRCYDLAKRGGVAVSPNPQVGALLVDRKKIVSEAFHQRYGGPHAEVLAVQQLEEEQRARLDQMTLYVSLEPCTHQGKTPPCVELILKHRIPRVVIGTVDPNPLVAGQGIARLRAAGVEVLVAEDQDRALAALGGFGWRHRHKRPKILLKYAHSADHYLGLPNQAVWLSNAFSKRLVHRWRSEIDAILIGTNTAEVDNPQLTTRLFPGPSPLRVVLDRQCRLADSLQIFQDKNQTLLVTQHEVATSKKSKWQNTEVLILDFGPALLPQLLEALLARGVNTLLVEGGAQVLQSFVEQGYWDEARVFSSRQKLGGGIPTPQLPSSLRYDQMDLAGDRLEYYRQ